MKAAINVLDNIVIKRQSSKMFKKKQNLCLDKGYDFQEIKDGVIRKDTCHIFHIEEKNNL